MEYTKNYKDRRLLLQTIFAKQIKLFQLLCRKMFTLYKQKLIINLTYNEIMLNNKRSQNKNILLSQINNPSLIKLPAVDKKHSHQDKHAISRSHRQKLPFINSNNKRVLYQHTERTVSELQNRYSIPENNYNQMEQIQAKMQKILNQKILPNFQQYAGQTDNFEEMILQNKQLLKIQRKQRASALYQNQLKGNYNSIIKTKLKNTNQNVSQNDNSGRINDQIQVKYSIRKDSKDKSSQSKLKQYQKHKTQRSSHSQSTVNMHPDINSHKLRDNGLAKQTKKKIRLATQGNSDYQKNSMFDNIHKYLVNQQINSKPKVKNNPINKQRLGERKSMLENKIMSIEKVIRLRGQPSTRMNQKSQDIQQQLRNTSSLNKSNVCNWHRIQMKSPPNCCTKKLEIRQSTFEGQIVQLSNLQLRSQHLLSLCLANQEKLLDLQQFTVNNSNRQKIQSQQQPSSK